MRLQRLAIVAAALSVMVGCGNGDNGHRRYETLPQPADTTARSTGTVVTTGRPGDHWLDTMQFLRVARASRDGQYGYEVTYKAPRSGATFILFWSRSQIDFKGTLPGYRFNTAPLGDGRLYYPNRLTGKSLPDVYRAIQIIEHDYAGEAEGAIIAAEWFAIIATLGGAAPAPRAPGTTVRTPSPASRTSVPSAQGGNTVRWGFWDDLPKVIRNGREYAKINGRLYTRHAIDRMAVRGFGTAAGKAGASGRGVPAMIVEDVIRNGTEIGRRVVDGTVRTQRMLGNVSVVTEGDIVITVITH